MGVAERILAPALGRRRAELWVEIAGAMARGGWVDATRHLATLNETTMLTRGGQGWVTVQSDISVRLRLGAPLPEQQEFVGGWLNPYYLTPVRSLDRDLARSGSS